MNWLDSALHGLQTNYCIFRRLQKKKQKTNHLLTRMDPDGHSTVYTLFDNNEQFKT